MKIQQNQAILFQVDSIPDCGRNREAQNDANDIHALGAGYPGQVAGALLANYPGHNLRGFNRGISGNRLLGRRWSPSLPRGACPNGTILAIKSGHLTAIYEMDVVDSGGRERRLALNFVSLKKNVADWRWRAFQTRVAVWSA